MAVKRFALRVILMLAPATAGPLPIHSVPTVSPPVASCRPLVHQITPPPPTLAALSRATRRLEVEAHQPLHTHSRKCHACQQSSRVLHSTMVGTEG